MCSPEVGKNSYRAALLFSLFRFTRSLHVCISFHDQICGILSLWQHFFCVTNIFSLSLSLSLSIYSFGQSFIFQAGELFSHTSLFVLALGYFF